MTMERRNELFLQAYRCALKGERLPIQEDVTGEEWTAILDIARIHNLLPMIFEAVYDQPGLKDMPVAASCRGAVRREVFSQTMRTVEFLQLYGKLRRAGVTPLVVKGMVCRNLYPLPDHRPSGDEDVLIPPEQFETAHRVMLGFGMTTEEPEENFESKYEIPYRKAGSSLYIELHKHLFQPRSGAYGHLNGYFEGVHDRAVEEKIQGAAILSMAPTDHLFYLICHAFKHFLHSGFGIRQVSDINLYATHYGSRIDWAQVLENCREIKAEKFAAAMFRIGENYLVFDPVAACYPHQWREILVDEGPMLADLLAAGVYGASDMSRKHSSNITLTAVENQKQGKNASGGVLKSLFPAAKDLEGRYPYLKKHRVLLPVAWASRIITYGRETASGIGNSAGESIRIGTERVALMKQYGILDE
jgi:hypothetical protein